MGDQFGQVLLRGTMSFGKLGEYSDKSASIFGNWAEYSDKRATIRSRSGLSLIADENLYCTFSSEE